MRKFAVYTLVRTEHFGDNADDAAEAALDAQRGNTHDVTAAVRLVLPIPASKDQE